MESSTDIDRTPTIERTTVTMDDLRMDDRIPHLIALTGAAAGTAYRLATPEVVVGRETDGLRLDHPGVSRRHARLRITGAEVVVEDLGSTNGTFVGVERIKRPRVVKEGDALAFGTQALFRLARRGAPAGGVDPQPERPAPPDAAREVGTPDFLLDLLQSECAHARRHRSALTFVFFRADGITGADAWTNVEVAELVLGSIATTIDDTVRTDGFLARSGSDEFAVLLRADAAAAAAIAERVRARTDSHAAFPERAPTWHTITAAVLPLVPATGRPQGTSAPGPAHVLSSARAVARQSMTGLLNQVLRLRPLAI
jgi:GGDEF domain-containing protein